MRLKKKLGMNMLVTLEQDIVEIFKKHNLKVSAIRCKPLKNRVSWHIYVEDEPS